MRQPVTSSQWYVADGFTVDDSVDELVLTNPYDVDAVINLDIATASGERSPAEYQGYPVPARSVAVVDLASLGARSEELPRRRRHHLARTAGGRSRRSSSREAVAPATR